MYLKFQHLILNVVQAHSFHSEETKIRICFCEARINFHLFLWLHTLKVPQKIVNSLNVVHLWNPCLLVFYYEKIFGYCVLKAKLNKFFYLPLKEKTQIGYPGADLGFSRGGGGGGA